MIINELLYLKLPLFITHATSSLHRYIGVQDYSLKAASLSNGSVAKRERLLQRNKILRRTGFIESETQLPGGGKGSEPAFPGKQTALKPYKGRFFLPSDIHTF